MNRYRNAPGVRGPSKATASTLCQKCLKRDIYECKVTAQERPYLARPSRTQQLQNPKLRPQLTTEVPDETTRTKGTADALLAQREQERGRKRNLDEADPLSSGDLTSKRTRSISSVSASSVSTISTNRSRSASLRRDDTGRARAKSLTSHHSYSRKRRHSDSSSGYSVSSYSSRERSRTRTPERNIRRRRRESSPKERGRPRDISRDDDRRDRSRSRSQSRNNDKNRNARGRRSMTPEQSIPERSYAARSPSIDKPNSSYNGRREDRGHRPPPSRRERSLSPYSKRIALTQAMNMGR